MAAASIWALSCQSLCVAPAERPSSSPVCRRFWRRYIYLWINYALFEELQAADVERTREVYRACLKVIPHEAFSFAKIWLMAAHFEVRQKDLEAARKILGQAIGRCGKEKIFKVRHALLSTPCTVFQCFQAFAFQLLLPPTPPSPTSTALPSLTPLFL